jgi:signal transduction histidine kinase
VENAEGFLGMEVFRDSRDGHGGSVGVTSQVGKGSSFCVRLPLDESNAPTNVK